MFANFTTETCTGTGLTLTLAGATTGQIPFSASYVDGDLVSYVVEDSGGVIKVAGIGTYNSTGNTITRNDTWNYNGTVVDKNPATNITLSGGTHTVRCDVSQNTLTPFVYSNNPFTYGRGVVGSNIRSLANGNQTVTPDTLYTTAHVLENGLDINKITFNVTNPGAAGEIAKVGIWQLKGDLTMGNVLYESPAILVDKTGFKSVSPTPFHVQGIVMLGFVSNSATVRVTTYGNIYGMGIYGTNNSNVAENSHNSAIGTAWQTGIIGNTPILGIGSNGEYYNPFIYLNAASI